MPTAKDTPGALVAIAKTFGASIRLATPESVDVEIRTATGGSVGVVISLERCIFGGHSFSPNGWTLEHLMAANAAMAQLLTLAVAIWDLYEVQP